MIYRRPRHSVSVPDGDGLDTGNRSNLRGGAASYLFVYNDLKDCVYECGSGIIPRPGAYDFVRYCTANDLGVHQGGDYVYCTLPLSTLVSKVNVQNLKTILTIHGIRFSPRAKRRALLDLANGHMCNECPLFVTTVRSISAPTLSPCRVDEEAVKFPPDPLSVRDMHTVLTAACSRFEKGTFDEAGCAVCGQLCQKRMLSPIRHVAKLLHILQASGISRLPRRYESDPIREIEGPVVVEGGEFICSDCRGCIRRSVVPPKALCRGYWIGEVPIELQRLNFYERMLVARVRHTVCFVKVTTGMRKMVGNVISWSSPVVHVYRILPPPKDDLNEAIAVLFTGPSSPTAEDFKRTPLLINLRHVKEALKWLILNHADYADVEYSEENLAQYQSDTPPLSYMYLHNTDPKSTEDPASFGVDELEGVEAGECPFIVHGICGDDLKSLTASEMKALALKYFSSGGKVLAVGRSVHPQSIFRNEQLYPQMFPWLFPYGYGGVGSLHGVSDAKHKAYLMMYYDKRFQVDPSFPFVSFSHEQIKTATTKAFLATERAKFGDISDRFLRLDKDVLTTVIERLRKDGHVVPETEQEKDCYDVINDLDAVTGSMHGSNTSKKWMRNEIWSLVYHCGSPIWYITFAPADNMHPLCLYYAGQKVDFEEVLLPPDTRLKLIAKNPAACARFFDYMVDVFINEVIGFDARHKGLYGPVEAYYGTVEQQGRLTLHLHSILWMTNGLSPRKMREHIMDKSSTFQNRLVQWLESCHMGGFVGSTFAQVAEDVNAATENVDYKNPVLSLPRKPPPACVKERVDCTKCKVSESWWEYFRRTVNDLLFRSNIHCCERLTNKDGTRSKKQMYKSCKDNRYNKCKARFPREVRESTLVDPETGSILMKHEYEWMNTISPILTFILGCNTDVTCLLSGTAVKAVLIYVSDYITKSALKTYAMFECIRAVLDKNVELIHSTSVSSEQKARVLMTKIANQLSAQMELGSPMICMYLLGNPDRYTAHHFKPFFWKSYVNEVRSAWTVDDQNVREERVSLIEKHGKLMIISKTLDYVHRPEELEDLCLYDFVKWCKREKWAKKNVKDDCEDRPDGIETVLDDDDGSDDRDDDDHTGRGSERVRKDKQTNLLAFMPAHPLADTHMCRRLSEDNIKIKQNRIVVNFLGGTPPRRDGNDTEYYYCAMLTFFSPWRSGKDLRAEEESWDDAFKRRVFRDEHTRVMDNFQLRYECLDSRNDFRAQMAGSDKEYLHPFFDDVGGDVIGDGDSLHDVEVNDDSVGMAEILSEPCKKERDNRVKAALMTELLDAIGWSTPSKLPLRMDVDPIQITRLPTSQWEALVKAEKEAVINSRRRDLPSGKVIDNKYAFTFNGVRVVDKSFLDREFIPQTVITLRENVASEFSLNDEQNRAFRMVADHAKSIRPPQLNLYIGGMGGTGKSQVLRALRSFFTSCDETHRIMVVAPTGNAASLVNGTTYHYAFGLNMPDSSNSLSAIRERLRGVDYIFFDEISMCSSHDLYKISSKLCRISGDRDVVFGGFNMIFAGDFAQLPPPIGGEAVSLYSDSRRDRRSKASQEQTIGQVAWHLVTNVVILRQNMRQKNQSVEDARFRSALENMRYKSCSADDIQFLKSLSSSVVKDGKAFEWDKFQNASIITGLNTNRDTINDVGVRRFAAENGLELVTFYSEDTCQDEEDDPSRRSKRRKKNSRGKSSNRFNSAVQKLIWDQPPGSTSNKIAGKLMLCRGLPVMLKYNFATELGMVNGQRGTVYDWHEGVGSFGQRILDVLFIKLTDPTKPVQIPLLPQNVVPVVKTSNEIEVKSPSGHSFNISRQQVEISYDFAMTDYASQGYTRTMNPVNLFDLRSHQGYYTALSRSSTAKGTAIIQGFDVKKITGGCSPALRREFRELEILDTITTLRCEGNLPLHVTGPGRRQLICQFMQTVRKDFMPSKMHPSLVWGDEDPLEIDRQKDEESKWTIVTDTKPSPVSDGYVPAEGTNAVRPDVASKGVSIEEARKLKRKRRDTVLMTDPISSSLVVPKEFPEGVVWSANSCAYDAAIVIIYNTWRDILRKRKGIGSSSVANDLVACFRRVDIGEYNLNYVQLKLKGWLSSLHPKQFVEGNFTSVVDIMRTILSLPSTIVESESVCPHGHRLSNPRRTSKTDSLFFSVNRDVQTTQDILPVASATTRTRCLCKSKLIRKTSFLETPTLLALDLTSTQTGSINRHITVTSVAGESSYRLSGLVYFGGHHFTARYINHDNEVWKHDGMLRGGRFVQELDVDLRYLEGRGVSLAVYALSD